MFIMTSSTAASILDYRIRMSSTTMLGSGTYGTVYCGVAPDGAPAAIKHTIVPGTVDDSNWYNVVLREATVAAVLPPHPNVMPIHAFGIFKGEDEDEEKQLNCYFPMPLGIMDLSDYITRNPTPITLATTRSWLYQIISGICHMHRHGIVHRDLKPDNVIMFSSGNLKITDFSNSRPMCTSANIPHAYTPETSTISVLCFESWLGLPYSATADVWSIGMTFVSLLIGKDVLYNLQKEDSIQTLVKRDAISGSSKSDYTRMAVVALFIAQFPIEWLEGWTALHSSYPKLAAYIRAQPPSLHHPLDTLFAVADHPICNSPLFPLLKRMLDINPHTRITSEEALSYLDGLDNPTDAHAICVLKESDSFEGKWTCIAGHTDRTPLLAVTFDATANTDHRADYITDYSNITPRMLYILRNWLMDVHRAGISAFAEFCTYRIIDRYLTHRKPDVLYKSLQLVGVAAGYLSAYTIEVRPPTVDFWVRMCDNTYTAQEVVMMAISLKFCAANWYAAAIHQTSPSFVKQCPLLMHLVNRKSHGCTCLLSSVDSHQAVYHMRHYEHIMMHCSLDTCDLPACLRDVSLGNVKKALPEKPRARPIYNATPRWPAISCISRCD